MTAGPADLDSLVAELERTAERLRDGDIEAGEAARLVERCAELATTVAAELDRQARAAEPLPGQEELL